MRGLVRVFLGLMVAAVGGRVEAQAVHQVPDLPEKCMKAFLSDEYESSIKFCRPAAEEGDDYAQTTLGFLYESGRGVSRDFAIAARWFRMAALQGNENAQSRLGVFYYYGNGVPQDYAEAAEWFRKAAVQEMESSQVMLGLMYHQGQGVEQDYSEAANWYSKAMLHGNRTALHFLSQLHFSGQGVKKDYAMGIRLAQSAAEKGSSLAQRTLGIAYATGDMGVPQDYITAHMFLNLAAASNIEDARKARDEVAESMTREQIAEAQKLAREWMEKHPKAE